MKSIYMFIALKIARKENKVRCKSTKEKIFCIFSFYFKYNYYDG